ncbi:UDP-N-acetylmuramate dehydrogenase [Telmatospirillum siberiense]|uniref:UDP-N-acetylenolpyruvoylglucosamine reductase n=1 Tax=Telmatospirillum siberiense TaxID=382514 RepID=A0A2N3PQL4_9PROT|nr:UDP-N-acetylmuramate dehydrogenase [Telmatospirillum siberiense]PKU22690.1 UDP-N-acetylenolpyruvoylglucosamine reductase [Telmatospirillum siberiense]
MNAMPVQPPLIERLPAVRGRLTEGASLASVTWFRTGGPAEVLFKPADPDDLAAFLAGTPEDVPLTVIGVGSNLLVRDGGVPGVVVRLGRDFAGIDWDDDRLAVGAGALDLTVSTSAWEAGVGGLEFLSGVPGTIGGALRMNAGAYGGEMAGVTLSARALDRRGGMHQLTRDDIGFSYRHAAVPEDWIFIDALLQGRRDEPAEIARRMAEIRRQREDSQPLRTRTGGSTFANPPGQKAWQLIDRAGCRGLARGGAQVSEKHCNFLINTGSASAADIEDLGEDVRRRVFETSGVTLVWEIRRIGVRARK